jgi:integrase
MYKLPSGNYAHQIRRKLGYWTFSLDTSNYREAQRRKSALNMIADSGRADILDRVASDELAFKDILEALAPGGAGIPALEPPRDRFHSITIAEACAAFKSEYATRPRNTQRIVAVIARQLEELGGSRACSSVSFEEAQRWLRRASWSARTQVQKLIYANYIWQLAISIEQERARIHGVSPILEGSPWESLAMPRTRDRSQPFLELNDIYHTLAEAHPRDAALLACGFLGTLRIGEASVLTWDDVDFENGTLRVRIQNDWHPKSSRGVRKVRAPIALMDALMRWRPLAYAGPFVFGGTKPLPERTAARWARTALDRAGHFDLTYHSGRHSAITNALSRGVPVHVVASQAGASPKTILDSYAHLVSNDADRMASALHLPYKLPYDEDT